MKKQAIILIASSLLFISLGCGSQGTTNSVQITAGSRIICKTCGKVLEDRTEKQTVPIGDKDKEIIEIKGELCDECKAKAKKVAEDKAFEEHMAQAKAYWNTRFALQQEPSSSASSSQSASSSTTSSTASASASSSQSASSSTTSSTASASASSSADAPIDSEAAAEKEMRQLHRELWDAIYEYEKYSDAALIPLDPPGKVVPLGLLATIKDLTAKTIACGTNNPGTAKDYGSEALFIEGMLNHNLLEGGYNGDSWSLELDAYIVCYNNFQGYKYYEEARSNCYQHLGMIKPSGY